MHKLILTSKSETVGQTINFIATDSRILRDKAIDPNSLTIDAVDDQLRIIVNTDAMPTANCDVAHWFGNFVNNNPTCMVHTIGGRNAPDKLNFALKGILSIGMHHYNMCIGLLYSPPNTHWYLCGQAITTCGNNEAANIEKSYFITATSHNEFQVQVKNAICSTIPTLTRA